MFVLGENSSLMYIGGEPLMRFWPVGGGHIFNMLDILDNRPRTRAVTKLCSELQLLRSDLECYAQLEIMARDEYEMKYGVDGEDEDEADYEPPSDEEYDYDPPNDAGVDWEYEVFGIIR